MKITRLAAVIELLAVYHPEGIKILKGLAPALSPDEWGELIESIEPNKESVFVQHDSSPEARVLSAISRAERVPGIISEAGGWDLIVAAVREVELEDGAEWMGFVRYCMIKTAPYRWETVTELAGQLHCDRSSVWRLRQRVPAKIAHKVVSGWVQGVLREPVGFA